MYLSCVNYWTQLWSNPFSTFMVDMFDALITLDVPLRAVSQDQDGLLCVSSLEWMRVWYLPGTVVGEKWLYVISKQLPGFLALCTLPPREAWRAKSSEKEGWEEQRDKRLINHPFPMHWVLYPFLQRETNRGNRILKEYENWSRQWNTDGWNTDGWKMSRVKQLGWCVTLLSAKLQLLLTGGSWTECLLPSAPGGWGQEKTWWVVKIYGRGSQGGLPIQKIR